MKINVEFELNRAWIIDNETDEEIGETNYVVPANWMQELFNKVYADKYESLDEFMEIYEPETQGEFIYRKAIEDGVLIKDLGVVMY